MAGNGTGGPWGNGGGNRGPGNNGGGDRPPSNGGQGPDLDDLVRKGQEQLRVLMGGYRVDTSEQSVELFFGEYYKTGNEGLNFAPWPVVTKQILPVTRENSEDIGVGRGARADEGLMLTGDENIVDIACSFRVCYERNYCKK